MVSFNRKKENPGLTFLNFVIIFYLLFSSFLLPRCSVTASHKIEKEKDKAGWMSHLERRKRSPDEVFNFLFLF